MTTSLFRSCSLRLAALGLASLLLPPGVRADTNNSGTVNCGDANTKSACIECCTEVVGCGLQISCCPLVGPCTIVNKITSALPALSVKDASGGLKLRFIRKIGLDGDDVLLKVSFLKATFPKGLVLKAHVAGTDARVGAPQRIPLARSGSGGPDRAPRRRSRPRGADPGVASATLRPDRTGPSADPRTSHRAPRSSGWRRRAASDFAGRSGSAASRA